MRNRTGFVVLMVAGLVLFGVVQAFSGPAKNGGCFGEDTYQLKPPEGVQAKLILFMWVDAAMSCWGVRSIPGS